MAWRGRSPTGGNGRAGTLRWQQAGVKETETERARKVTKCMAHRFVVSGEVS